MCIFIFSNSNYLKVRHYPINKGVLHLTDLLKRELCVLKGEKCHKPIMIMRTVPNVSSTDELLAYPSLKF